MCWPTLTQATLRVQDLAPIGLNFATKLAALREEIRLRPPNGTLTPAHVPARLKRGLSDVQLQLLAYFACRGDKKPATLLQLVTEVATDIMALQLEQLFALPLQPPPEKVLTHLFFGRAFC